jgi:hypothetical protein
MQKIQTRSALLAQVSRLKAENRRLQGMLGEIADIVIDDGPQDENDDYEGDEDEEV